MIETIIPNFVNELMMDSKDPFDIDWPQECHRRGINLRHLGYLKSLFWKILPGRGMGVISEDVVHFSEEIKDDLKVNSQVLFSFIVDNDKEKEIYCTIH